MIRINIIEVMLVVPSPIPIVLLTRGNINCGNKSVIIPISFEANGLIPSDAMQMSTTAPTVPRTPETSTADKHNATEIIIAASRALLTVHP